MENIYAQKKNGNKAVRLNPAPTFLAHLKSAKWLQLFIVINLDAAINHFESVCLGGSCTSFNVGFDDNFQLFPRPTTKMAPFKTGKQTARWQCAIFISPKMFFLRCGQTRTFA